MQPCDRYVFGAFRAIYHRLYREEVDGRCSKARLANMTMRAWQGLQNASWGRPGLIPHSADWAVRWKRPRWAPGVSYACAARCPAPSGSPGSRFHLLRGRDRMVVSVLRLRWGLATGRAWLS